MILGIYAPVSSSTHDGSRQSQSLCPNPGIPYPHPPLKDVVVAPTFLHIPAVVDALRPEFKVAAQNSWVKGNGAYTGEITADQIADLGLEWVILGHSERRHIVKESDELTADKVAYALSKGLSVIFCIGEKLEEREANQTQEVNARQLQVRDAGVLLVWADWQVSG